MTPDSWMGSHWEGHLDKDSQTELGLANCLASCWDLRLEFHWGKQMGSRKVQSLENYWGCLRDFQMESHWDCCWESHLERSWEHCWGWN